MRRFPALMLALILAATALLTWKLCNVQTPTAVAALPKKWHDQAYGLDEGEVLRLIPPPFSPARAKAIPPFPSIAGNAQIALGLSDIRQVYGGSSSPGTIGSAIRLCMQLKRECEVAPDLGRVPAAGDWVVQTDASVERRMTALLSILRQVTKRDLLVESRPVETEVVVARGKWDFHPVEVDAATAGRLARVWNTYVHLFVEESDLSRSGGVSAGDLRKFLDLLQTLTRQKILDEIEEPRPKTVRWAFHGGDYARDEKWKPLLANVGKQTSLSFKVETRPLPYWILRERSAVTRPVDRR